MRKSRYLLLALVIWLGQVTLLVHAMDAHAHSAGDVCEICVQASPAGGALIPHAVLIIPAPTRDEAPVRTEHRAGAAVPLADAQPRGPPTFS